MKDSQQRGEASAANSKYIKANNERFSTYIVYAGVPE